MNAGTDTPTKINFLAERKNRGLSQRAMAKEIGVSTRAWKTAEEGGEPRGGSAKLIAEYFGFTVVQAWPIEDAA
jgi:transcriptional regulator with XRE-family HTH domain